MSATSLRSVCAIGFFLFLAFFVSLREILIIISLSET